MKTNKLLFLAILLTVITLYSCPKEEAESLTFDKDASYALGLAYGMNIRNSTDSSDYNELIKGFKDGLTGKNTAYAVGIDYGMSVKDNIDSSGLIPDYDELMKGFRDSVNGRDTRFDINEAMALLEAVFTSMTNEKTAGLRQEEISFFAENARKPGIIITPSGLQYEVIKEGTGQKPSENSTVLVHYTGTYTDDSLFDSSHQYGRPMEINLNRVISGWAEGLQLMSVGSNYILYIPSELGYGSDGLLDRETGMELIPPYAALIFDVELLDIINN